ncbi:hypothetical protein [Borrelia miyamotoi]|uniref:Lipoprotein n=1 Tax=Borrelia miyamotoi TaxID=47466 RepID=A0A5P8AUX1_9SPIR|nr:hypothetical protein [Borrelia miyamotoi]ATQ18935.1 hypothetical protein CNO11_05095 [Borrelia miyamotoi]ATQ19009.1 hypothetical protein CNO11_05560 [Borrelia miyamotoi]ATQ19054.1 hypothetical protein CNO11_05820 [Borrelia miyamotoi]WVI05727.1 hypothetical protein F9Y91_02615 [Borrelia miyamotoi]
MFKILILLIFSFFISCDLLDGVLKKSSVQSEHQKQSNSNENSLQIVDKKINNNFFQESEKM